MQDLKKCSDNKEHLLLNVQHEKEAEFITN